MLAYSQRYMQGGRMSTH